MTLKEIRGDATFTDQGRQALSLFRLHMLQLQRNWGRVTASSDLEEIGRRAIIYNEIICALEDLITPVAQPQATRRKRLNNQSDSSDSFVAPKNR